MPKTCDHPGCTKPVWGGKKCTDHQRFRTDEKWLKSQAKQKEKRSQPKKSIAKFTPKYAKEVSKYNKRTVEYKKENPICCVVGCERSTTSTHHMISRGIHINNEKYWRHMCTECHDRVKLDEAWAIENELILTKTISRKNEY